jgi:hypothetical protein
MFAIANSDCDYPRQPSLHRPTIATDRQMWDTSRWNRWERPSKLRPLIASNPIIRWFAAPQLPRAEGNCGLPAIKAQNAARLVRFQSMA